MMPVNMRFFGGAGILPAFCGGGRDARATTNVYHTGMGRNLSGMVVVITGASAGIGRRLAIDLHVRGTNLVLAARRAEKMAEVDRVLDGKHLCLTADVSNPDDCARLIASAVERFGRIDTLVANAGWGAPAAVHEVPAQQARDMFATNVFGTIDCIRAAVPVMLAQQRRDGWRGQVMIVSSGAARRGLPYMGVYSATKAAQLSIAEAMRVELRDQKIAVTSVHPIGTETDFFTTAEALGKTRIQTGTRRGYRQSVEHVSRRMMRAIEWPVEEVWPHRLTRWALAVNAILPQFGDRIMLKEKREMDAMNA